MMNKNEFAFMRAQESSSAVAAKPQAARSACEKRGAHAHPPHMFPQTVVDGERFLRIVEQSSRVKRHFELFQLMQGAEIQHFIPHQVLISAWGNFNEPHMKIDVVSAVPGIRTGLLKRCSVDNLVKDLYRRWLAHGRQPLMLDSTMPVLPADASCGCALHKALNGVWSVLVHGIADVRDGGDSLYLLLNASALANTDDIERFRSMADPLIAQIDAAFRRIGALKASIHQVSAQIPHAAAVLSAREEEILVRVAEGKTNFEIANCLGISSFTAKNHLQRIMRKLDATNRTEAVAKYHQLEPARH